VDVEQLVFGRFLRLSPSLPAAVAAASVIGAFFVAVERHSASWAQAVSYDHTIPCDPGAQLARLFWLLL
jgi:hypothetical protein